MGRRNQGRVAKHEIGDLGASGWFGEDGYATTLTDPKS